jgi:hypothetical protein
MMPPTAGKQMEESGKETIIIVHGTWAAPKLGKTQWYQRPDDVSPTKEFVSKLDAALQVRGSPARCWAHCTNGNPIFQWSGENSWIARTRAAGVLADYLAKLREEGWRCHIVAHSHGGNVVVEALPQIMAAPDPNKSHGVIVTLGSPFMDIMAPVLKRVAQARRILALASWIAIAVTAAGFAWFSYFLWEGGERYTAIFYTLVVISLVTQLFVYFPRNRPSDLHGSVQDQPPFFAMSSFMDEAWQILHHIGTIQNPLAVKSNLLRYLFASLRSDVSRAAQRDRIDGAKSYRDLELVAKLVLIFIHVFAIAFILLMIVFAAAIAIVGTTGPDTIGHDIYLIIIIIFKFSLPLICGVLLFTKLFGESFYSAFLSPFRWCARGVATLGLIFPEMATYFIRGRGWSVLQAIAMGLEGYRFKMPVIEQFPRNLPEKFVKYENMPADAEQRAMNRRSAWVARHLGDVSQTFAKLAITVADITSLLRTIEDDQTLVHAAYYTDDECIARIADWITGRT